MAMISVLNASGAIGSVAQAARQVAEVFTPNATRGAELAHEARAAALQQFAAEFSLAPQGRFDRFVNGLNRLPRPMLALGTLGLFVYAMADPTGFSKRMQGLQTVPEPLWWLLGAIVAFYFGAREIHHARISRSDAGSVPKREAGADEGDNPAVERLRHAYDSR